MKRRALLQLPPEKQTPIKIVKEGLSLGILRFLCKECNSFSEFEIIKCGSEIYLRCPVCRNRMHVNPTQLHWLKIKLRELKRKKIFEE